jgi:hypothetical protein
MMTGMYIADMKNAAVQTDVSGPVQTIDERSTSMVSKAQGVHVVVYNCAQVKVFLFPIFKVVIHVLAVLTNQMSWF